jgi:tetratricopeptide (TPR) repeat protein
LRGRIEPDWEKQESIYRRTIELDPRLPWPWMALGGRAEAGARWEEAVRCLERAQELAIDPELIRSAMQTARLGAGGALALVPELRVQLSSQPADVGAVVSLCEALAASGQADKIDAEINAWQNRATPTVPVEVIATVRALGLYYAGRLEECAARCRFVPSLKSGGLHLESLLAQKKAKEVTADPAFSRILADPRFALSVSLAFVMENQPAEASRWRDTAIANLANESRGMRRAAQILADAAPTPAAEFDRLYMDADWKAAALMLMAERHPAKRSEYVASAVRFNVRRRPPYHLLRQAIERALRAGK